jgi:rsbT co-antagonist protein RsbR
MANERDFEDLDERITDMLEGIAAATRGEYDVRISPAERDDALVEVEVALNMLFDELALAKIDNETQKQEIAEQSARLAERDRALVRALSTPIITVWPGVITLPLIGRIDEERQSVISETLLSRVADEGATYVILDVTGVAEADVSMVNALVSTARAVGLLGAQTIITGVTAAVARAMVELDVQVNIPTMARVSEALSWVFRDKQQNKRQRQVTEARTRKS